MVTEIRRERLADQAYELLKERILARELLPGERLSVPAIAAELQLSRSPVREAVQRLVQEGLGDERPHSGAVVAAADLPALIELYLVRSELEGLSCELAASADDPDLLADLEKIQSAHEKAHDDDRLAQMIRADVAFHTRVLDASGNRELARILTPVLNRMLLGMLAADRTWPVRAMAEHRDIMAALQQGDPREARKCMIAHVLRVRTDMQHKLTQLSDTTALEAQ